MSENIFEVATRNKIRFTTSKGTLSVEDLWDLPLTSTKSVSLDSLAVDLQKQINATSEVTSFVQSSNTRVINQGLQLQFDLVKHVLDARVAQNAAASARAATAALRQKALAELERRKEAAYTTMSDDELISLAGGASVTPV